MLEDSVFIAPLMVSETIMQQKFQATHLRSAHITHNKEKRAKILAKKRVVSSHFPKVSKGRHFIVDHSKNEKKL